jgi:membrane protein required for colicin V production
VARALFASVGEKLAEELGTSLTFAQVVAFILIWLLVPLVFISI